MSARPGLSIMRKPAFAVARTVFAQPGSPTTSAGVGRDRAARARTADLEEGRVTAPLPATLRARYMPLPDEVVRRSSGQSDWACLPLPNVRIPHFHWEPRESTLEVRRAVHRSINFDCLARRVGRETVDCASGPASEVSAWCGRRVGGLGPGLTSESADAVRAVLRSICRPGPAPGTHRRCRSDLPGLRKRPGFAGPTASGCVPPLNLRKGWP
jgi:hypothetical protein